MREILFRGKRTDNGEWAEGDLYRKTDALGEKETIIFQDKGADAFKKNFVNSETVGQYTGLKDKNGNKIFEGDILKYSSEIFYVNYNERFATFECKHYNNMRNTPSITPITCGRMEVIGNIFDNHELLEGSGK